MNVVRLVRNFPSYEKISYGLAPAFYYLSREQVKLGVNVHVICKRSPYEKKSEKIEGIQIHRVAPPYGLSAVHRLIKLNRHMKIDLVHAHATSCLSYAILRRYLPELTDSRYLVHVHGTTRGVMSAYKKFLPEFLGQTTLRQHFENLSSSFRQNVVWKRAETLIAVSQSVADELVNLYSIARKRIHVIGNGVDLQTFHPVQSRKMILRQLGLKASDRIILYLGGFRPVKGPTFLVQAAKRMSQEAKNIKIIFVGNPKHPLEKHYVGSVLSLIKHLKVKNTLRLTKNIPYVHVPKYMSAADALVVPSIYEASPKVLFEAMACGTPLVASAVGGTKDIVRTDETGILVKPGDSNELAEAIMKIADNPDLRHKISLNSKKLVKEQFTWTHAARRNIKVYRELQK